jgi:hypothetical protein
MYFIIDAKEFLKILFPELMRIIYRVGGKYLGIEEEL